MKECIRCRAMIPDDAEFCFSCAAAQTEKREGKMPVLRSRKIRTACMILLVLIAAAAAVLLATGKKTVDNGAAELLYRRNGAVWHVLLRNAASDDIHWQTPQGTYRRVIREERTGAIPLQLYVYDERTGDSRAEQFRQLIGRSEITVKAAGGSNAADYGNPEVKPGFPQAALVTDIVFDSTCNDNEIVWTLHMKNGDRLVLHEQMQITVMKREEHSWETEKLDTSADLQAVIDAAGESGEEKEVILRLGPAVYEEEIRIDKAAVRIIGYDGPDGETVFRGGIRVGTSSPYACTFEKLRFEGETAGITAARSCFAEDCTFSGPGVGIEGADGSWPMPSGCVFENCRIGLHMDSSFSESRNGWFGDNVVRGNGTAVLLERMPSGDDLYFVRCVFEDNGTDMDSRVENRILYEME